MRRILLALSSLVFTLAACSSGETATPDSSAAGTEVSITATAEVLTGEGVGRSITLTDALDREVTLPSAPQRIVITGKGLIMIVDAAYMFPSASQRIIGMGNASQGPVNFISMLDQDFEDKAILANDATAEQIAAMGPDLLLLKSSMAEWMIPSMEALGIPVVIVDFETPEQYARDLAILGKVFGDEERAVELAAFFQTKADEVTAKIAGAVKPSTLLLHYSDRDGIVAFYVPPLGWMQTLMVEMAGGDPVWKDASLGYNWTQVTLEQVAAWDADQIFIISYIKDPSEVVATLKNDPTWQALRAIRTGKLHAFAGDVYSWDQPDPRWILGLSWLAFRLHPDLFSSYDPVLEAQVFYQTLYGLDASFFETNILPSFRGDLP